ncbi:hypothetical protein ACLHIJ_06540 [Trueperella sp. LYQ141]
MIVLPLFNRQILAVMQVGIRDRRVDLVESTAENERQNVLEIMTAIVKRGGEYAPTGARGRGKSNKSHNQI